MVSLLPRRKDHPFSVLHLDTPRSFSTNGSPTTPNYPSDFCNLTLSLSVTVFAHRLDKETSRTIDTRNLVKMARFVVRDTSSRKMLSLYYALSLHPYNPPGCRHTQITTITRPFAHLLQVPNYENPIRNPIESIHEWKRRSDFA